MQDHIPHHRIRIHTYTTYPYPYLYSGYYYRLIGLSQKYFARASELRRAEPHIVDSHICTVPLRFSPPAMKFILAILAASATAELINDAQRIKDLNADGDSWVAGENEFFAGKTFDDVKGLLGTTFPSDAELAAIHAASDLSHLDGVRDPPASFDSRDQWGDLIQPIRDQQQCGSCWAFSANEVLSDRFSIATNTSVILSPEDSVSCDKGNMGCNGGT